MGFHLAWIEQCRAAVDIRERWGLDNALSYLVGEKLLAFVRAAERDPRFATELPKFASEVRRLFESWEIESYLDAADRASSAEQAPDNESIAEAVADEMLDVDDVVHAAEDVIHMGRIRERLVG
jgi:hypothetical protein